MFGKEKVGRGDNIHVNCQVLSYIDYSILIAFCKFISRKSPKRGRGGDRLRTHFFENPRGSFHIFTLSLKISEKAQLNPWIFHKIVLDPLEIPRPKTKTPCNRTLFFLGYSWKFHSFLLNPWKFHMLFLWYPWKFHILNPPCLDFFWNSPILCLSFLIFLVTSASIVTFSQTYCSYGIQTSVKIIHDQAKQKKLFSKSFDMVKV